MQIVRTEFGEKASDLTTRPVLGINQLEPRAVLTKLGVTLHFEMIKWVNYIYVSLS